MLNRKFFQPAMLVLVLTATVACSRTSKSTSTGKTPTSNEISSNFDVSIFPKPESGYKIVIVQVPPLANETEYKVEILVGKTMDIDCNHYFMMGESETKSVDLWGYNYTVFKSDGGIAGTKMGCPENSIKSAFVHMTPLMSEYHSQYPEVLYVPEFCEVKYRIWTRNNTLLNATSVKSVLNEKGLIEDCPDEKIINAMPSFGDDGTPKEYYIYKGNRKELKDFDEDWVKKNCTVKTTTVH